MVGMDRQQIINGNMHSLLSALVLLTSRTLQPENKTFSLKMKICGDEITFSPDTCFDPSARKAAKKQAEKINRILSEQGLYKISEASLKVHPDTGNMDIGLNFEEEPSEEQNRIINSAFESLGNAERL